MNERGKLCVEVGNKYSCEWDSRECNFSDNKTFQETNTTWEMGILFSHSMWIKINLQENKLTTDNFSHILPFSFHVLKKIFSRIINTIQIHFGIYLTLWSYVMGILNKLSR